MYPNPVSGRVGGIPSVTNASCVRAAAAAARRAARNAGSSRTAWSDGSTASTASGVSSEAASAERAIAGAVLRRTGSRTRRARGTSGSSARRSSSCDARPETKTFPAPASFAARRQASRSSDSPPVSARKGFGLPSVERGHSRVPLPPARMSARSPAVLDIPEIVRAPSSGRSGARAVEGRGSTREPRVRDRRSSRRPACRPRPASSRRS